MIPVTAADMEHARNVIQDADARPGPPELSLRIQQGIALALAMQRESCAKQCDAAAAECRKRAGIMSDGAAHRYVLAAQNFDTAAAFIRGPKDQP